MAVDKVIAKIIWLTFFGPPCIVNMVDETTFYFSNLCMTPLLLPCEI